MGDDRPPSYVDNDDGTPVAIYRASALGHTCIRAIVAGRLNFTPLPVPAKVQLAYDEGTLLEPVVLERLEREYGWTLTGLQDELEIPVTPRIRIRLHPDAACATHPDVRGERVVEVKNFGDSLWDKYQSEGIAGFPGYMSQLTLEMVATGRMGLFVVARKFSDDPLNITHFEEPPASINQIKAWVLRAEHEVRKAEAGELMPACDRDMYPCPFLYLHDGTPAGLEVTEDAALDALAATYQHGADLEAQGKQIKSELRGKLLAALGERPKVQTPRWRVQRVVQQRSGLDMDALKDAVDLAPFQRTTEVEQLRVKEVGAA